MCTGAPQEKSESTEPERAFFPIFFLSLARIWKSLQTPTSAKLPAVQWKVKFRGFWDRMGELHVRSSQAQEQGGTATPRHITLFTLPRFKCARGATCALSRGVGNELSHSTTQQNQTHAVRQCTRKY